MTRLREADREKLIERLEIGLKAVLEQGPEHWPRDAAVEYVDTMLMAFEMHCKAKLEDQLEGRGDA